MLMITVQFRLWDDALIWSAAQREYGRIEKFLKWILCTVGAGWLWINDKERECKL